MNRILMNGIPIRSNSGAGGTTHGDSWEASDSESDYKDAKYKRELQKYRDAHPEQDRNKYSQQSNDSMMMSGG